MRFRIEANIKVVFKRVYLSFVFLVTFLVVLAAERLFSLVLCIEQINDTYHESFSMIQPLMFNSDSICAPGALTTSVKLHCSTITN